MFEKDLTVGLLLDFYGDVLNEHTRSFLSMYYGDDLSLAEIAEDAGISRQGVRQIIKKGENELRLLEEKLGLAKQFAALRDSAKRLRDASMPLMQTTDPLVSHLVKEAMLCADLISEENA